MLLISRKNNFKKLNSMQGLIMSRINSSLVTPVYEIMGDGVGVKHGQLMDMNDTDYDRMISTRECQW